MTAGGPVNPLIELAEHAGLPAFDRIRPEHVEPAVDLILARNRREIAALLAAPTAADWAAVLGPLEDIGDRLPRLWPTVTQFWAVCNDEPWRAAYNACLAKITDYGLELSQSELLFRAYERVAQGAGFAGESGARRKAVNDALRDFRLAGVALAAAQKDRYRTLCLRLSELQTGFEEALLDASQAWTLHLTDEQHLIGMTVSGKAQAAARAQSRSLNGWLLSLDFPAYDAVIRYADDRELRAKLYEAYATRASDAGPRAGQHDNGPRMAQILALRHEQAQLLGYANFVELSLATKMAESPAAVERFLLELAAKARPHAERELQELRTFAGLDKLQPWDVPYYAEKLRQKTLGLSQEALRPYFPLGQVLQGLFALLKRLYGIGAQRLAMPLWHADASAWTLQDGQGHTVAHFFLDPFAREQKRGGAWMDECRVRRQTASGLQTPVAFLTCNFAPPLAGGPALLTHEEVVTLFHEFGHGLHHMLTRVDVAAVSGIRGVEWDAVELPSQFMENWCYAPESLALIARHHETGAPLPQDLQEKLQRGRRFQAALATLRQVEFALLDLRVHRDFRPGAGDAATVPWIYQTLKSVRQEVSVLPPPEWNRFPHSFSHVFAGGYAAGYYSYKWAEVLSADAFSAFEEEGLFNAGVGTRFRETILAQGGSRPAMELFESFRGRPPRIEPLLRQSGIE